MSCMVYFPSAPVIAFIHSVISYERCRLCSSDNVAQTQLQFCGSGRTEVDDYFDVNLVQLHVNLKNA